MIHEGPLLEYAGRDLAYLQWAAAARHWVVAVLAVALFLPHPADPWAQLALLPLGVAAVCLLLAAVETLRREDAHPARAAAARRGGCDRGARPRGAARRGGR